MTGTSPRGGDVKNPGRLVIIAAGYSDADRFLQAHLGMRANQCVVVTPKTKWHSIAGIRIAALLHTGHPESGVSLETEEMIRHIATKQESSWVNLMRAGDKLMADFRERQR